MPAPRLNRPQALALTAAFGKPNLGWKKGQTCARGSRDFFWG